jgi:hypothetical protein
MVKRTADGGNTDDDKDINDVVDDNNLTRMGGQRQAGSFGALRHPSEATIN